MARPREFSTDDALGQAMDVFWSKGYQATTLGDLTRAMGISKSSFYDTFGSKHALYLASLERYRAAMHERLLAGLESEAPARAAIAAVFAHIVEAAEGDRRGCFIGNCASEMAPHDAAAARQVTAGLDRLEAAYAAAVERGQRAGEIAGDREPRALARYLTSSTQGLQLMAKASPDRAALADVVRIVLAALD